MSDKYKVTGYDGPKRLTGREGKDTETCRYINQPEVGTIHEVQDLEATEILARRVLDSGS